ncbi:DUF2513 domain-containing protein [Alkalicoccobacillus murimartini]|uniref:DUF2513 domain-containing protein n=1 Tax=Alkalicoccobacillus murimartini TaxID=171685 RepID=A0ABT9YPD5_9BACI|nr:DUF2513 domain-containing protein [Alkalicoccobacillus murimartini]MDQ0208889.1 hypothetical protein [Alkalicoccobacillus murimartini]
MELVRLICLEVEEKGDARGTFVVPKFENYSRDQVMYHMKLLIEAGLISGMNQSTKMNLAVAATSLTWSDHEFLDAIKNDTVWTKVKKKVKEEGGSMPIQMVKALGMKFLEQQVFGTTTQ